jgi:hypothetical protein
MDEQHGPNQKLQFMSNMDPTKNYKKRATRTQPKTTIDEQHGSNQKLQWMSNMDPTKNYNR